MANKGRQEVKGSAMENKGKAGNESLDTIKAEQDKWEKSVCAESLARAPEKRSEFRTGSGEFVVKRNYPSKPSQVTLRPKEGKSND